MKLPLILSAAFFGAASAFTPPPQQTIKTSTSLHMGFFDFNPFHGHGSGENDIEDQWEAQQAILRDRRAHGIDKEHLKLKYKNAEELKGPDLHAMPYSGGGEEMYVDEGDSQQKKRATATRTKFFWEK